MNKILLVVEDGNLIRPIANLYECMGFSVRVFPIYKPLHRSKKFPDLIILGVYKQIDQMVLRLKRICYEVPRVRVICLTVSKSSKLRRVMRMRGVISIKITGDIFCRLYKKIKLLRGMP